MNLNTTTSTTEPEYIGDNWPCRGTFHTFICFVCTKRTSNAIKIITLASFRGTKNYNYPFACNFITTQDSCFIMTVEKQ